MIFPHVTAKHYYVSTMLSPFCLRGNWGLGRLKNLPKVTRLICRRAEIWTFSLSVLHVISCSPVWVPFSFFTWTPNITSFSVHLSCPCFLFQRENEINRRKLLMLSRGSHLSIHLHPCLYTPPSLLLPWVTRTLDLSKDSPSNPLRSLPQSSSLY